MRHLIAYIIFVLVIELQAQGNSINTTIICENKLDSLSCPPHYVIQIKEAIFGRQTTSVCGGCSIPGQCSYTNCSLDVTSTLASMCDRKHNCDITPSDKLLGDPCFGTIKYLQVTYECVMASSCLGNNLIF